jgi:hypothetical protein
VVLLDIFKFKKADGGLTIVLVIVIIVVFLGWLVNLGSKECRSNSDCSNDFYCGSDFSCHQIPVIEKTVSKNNFVMPSIIISIAIVIAAFILKSDKLRFRRKKPEQTALKYDKNNEQYSQKLKTP